MRKKENIIILRPVKIFIDDLEKIFGIIYSKYKENELTIETDDYFYYNFEELSRSPEDIIYKLNITVEKKKTLEINFKDGIYMKSDDKDDKGLVLKIKNILSDKKLIKRLFPYFFIKHNELFFNIFVILLPMSLFLIFKISYNYIGLFFIFIFLYVISYRNFFKRNAEKFLYSTIILHKKSAILKNDLKLDEKRIPKIILIINIIGLFIPLLAVLLNLIITRLLEG